jgi:hypothetical protein
MAGTMRCWKENCKQPSCKTTVHVFAVIMHSRQLVNLLCTGQSAKNIETADTLIQAVNQFQHNTTNVAIYTVRAFGFVFLHLYLDLSRRLFALYKRHNKLISYFEQNKIRAHCTRLPVRAAYEYNRCSS